MRLAYLFVKSPKYEQIQQNLQFLLTRNRDNRKDFWSKWVRWGWKRRSTYLMDPPLCPLMRPCRPDIFCNPSRKKCFLSAHLQFLSFLVIGKQITQQLMLSLALMIPFMISMASPNPCTRYAFGFFFLFLHSFPKFCLIVYISMYCMWYLNHFYMFFEKKKWNSEKKSINWKKKKPLRGWKFNLLPLSKLVVPLFLLWMC